MRCAAFLAKDTTKGLRGYSSLFAALDAAVEVSRDGKRRDWRVAKSKDGQDGDAQPFKLQIETLAIDDHGEAITSCVVVRDTAAQDVRAVKVPQGGNRRLVYASTKRPERNEARRVRVFFCLLLVATRYKNMHRSL